MMFEGSDAELRQTGHDVRHARSSAAMSPLPPTPAQWLPDHQLEVVKTFAHVDHLIDEIGRLVHTYLSPPGPLTFKNVPRRQSVDVIVARIRPLPAAISRLYSDVMVNLRAALEHTLYAEVEHVMKRPLEEREARSISMPSIPTRLAFVAWQQRMMRRVAVMGPHHDVGRRIDAIQPYHRSRDPEAHPLSVLVAHSNWSKHRTPAVATTRIALMRIDRDHPDVKLAKASLQEPLAPGDVIATGPHDAQVPLDVYPTISVRRPVSGSWHVLMHELRDIERWVREVGVPVLITGDPSRTDRLPPTTDITVGHEDLRQAMPAGPFSAAADRAEARMMAAIARAGLAETLRLHPRGVPGELINGWVDELDDNAVMTYMARLEDAAVIGPLESAAEVARMLDEATPDPHHRGKSV